MVPHQAYIVSDDCMIYTKVMATILILFVVLFTHQHLLLDFSPTWPLSQDVLDRVEKAALIVHTRTLLPGKKPHVSHLLCRSHYCVVVFLCNAHQVTEVLTDLSLSLLLFGYRINI